MKYFYKKKSNDGSIDLEIFSQNMQSLITGHPASEDMWSSGYYYVDASFAGSWR